MSIPIESYLSSGVFEHDCQAIFHRHAFVAHQSEVAGDDHYFSFRVGNRSTTLRRFGPDIVLLDNVCRHRSNLIDPPGAGARAFRCAYHGWSYGATGGVEFAPLRDQFDCGLPALDRYHTRNDDGFLFLDSGDDALAQSRIDGLSHVDRPEGEPFHRGVIGHQCNWKLLVENVLEGYHLSCVHPQTFGKAGYTTTSRSDGAQGHWWSLMRTHAHADHAHKLRAFDEGAEASYSHLYVFPNLFVSITNGLVCFLSFLVPEAANATQLHYRLFETKRLASQARAVREFVKEQAVAFTATTLEEDREIVENCQTGLACATHGYVLGKLEQRIAHFHDLYRRFA
jgi:phenylpropionate dioxygenase-like ring-hydroxylating dioxygenase large terminal subunit